MRGETQSGPAGMFGSEARRRRGMTLVEILIAIGILALGMIGIVTLFFVAIRNTATASHRNVGASVARTAFVSLQAFSVDLSLLSDTPPPEEIRGEIQTGVGKIPLDGSGDSLPAAIKAYSDYEVGEGRAAISPTRGFMIPQDLDNAGDFGNGSVVDYLLWDPDAAKWRPTDYGWSVALVPQEDTIDEATTYSVQVAVWRGRRTIPVGSAKADFTADDFEVTISDADTDFWDALREGDYLRNTEHGVWYQIVEVADPDVTLAQAFPHVPPNDDTAGNFEVAGRFRLVSLSLGAIGPPR